MERLPAELWLEIGAYLDPLRDLQALLRSSRHLRHVVLDYLLPKVQAIGGVDIARHGGRSVNKFLVFLLGRESNTLQTLSLCDEDEESFLRLADAANPDALPNLKALHVLSDLQSAPVAAATQRLVRALAPQLQALSWLHWQFEAPELGLAHHTEASAYFRDGQGALETLDKLTASMRNLRRVTLHSNFVCALEPLAAAMRQRPQLEEIYIEGRGQNQYASSIRHWFLVISRVAEWKISYFSEDGASAAFLRYVLPGLLGALPELASVHCWDEEFDVQPLLQAFFQMNEGRAEGRRLKFFGHVVSESPRDYRPYPEKVTPALYALVRVQLLNPPSAEKDSLREPFVRFMSRDGRHSADVYGLSRRWAKERRIASDQSQPIRGGRSGSECCSSALGLFPVLEKRRRLAVEHQGASDLTQSLRGLLVNRL